MNIDVDINLSREEIARLGVTRPFWKFVSFPIVLSEEVLNDKTYALPEDGDFTEKTPMGETIGLPAHILSDKTITWSAMRGGIESIGLKPEPIQLYVEKDKMDGKETYISPFTGRVT